MQICVEEIWSKSEEMLKLLREVTEEMVREEIMREKIMREKLMREEIMRTKIQPEKIRRGTGGQSGKEEDGRDKQRPGSCCIPDASRE